MIKAIFFDIDGTLVSFHQHHVKQEVKEALKKLREKGIKIIVATGRGKDGLSVINDIEFDGYITLNGQFCFTKDKIIYQNKLDKEDLKALINYLDKYPHPCGFTLKDTKIFNYRDERVEEIHCITLNDGHPAGDVSHIDEKDVLQVMCFVSPEEEKELMEQMPHSHSARWHPLFADISPLGGTKSLGMKMFGDYFGFTQEETMAFGDGGNDKEMIEYAHIGVAMGNGDEELKKISDYITQEIDNDGIIHALKHFKLL